MILPYCDVFVGFDWKVLPLHLSKVIICDLVLNKFQKLGLLVKLFASTGANSGSEYTGRLFTIVVVTVIAVKT